MTATSAIDRHNNLAHDEVTNYKLADSAEGVFATRLSERQTHRRRCMKKLLRLLSAVLASSLSVVPLYLVAMIVIGESNNAFLLIALMVAPMFAFIGVIFVGLPVHFFLSWRRLTHPLYYGLAGFGASALFMIAMQYYGRVDINEVVTQALFYGGIGAILALVFRYIALGGKSAQ